MFYIQRAPVLSLPDDHARAGCLRRNAGCDSIINTGWQETA